MPHENIIVEDNDTSYNLENLFGTCFEEYDNCYTIGAIHTINDESDYAYNMKRPKLGDAMFDEDDVFENIFVAINVCPKLGDATLNEVDIFSLPSFDMQIYNDDSMPPTYDDYIDESGFGRVSTLELVIPLFWRMFNLIVMNMKVDLEECQLYLVIPLSWERFQSIM